jgi:hypothetical protein
VENISSLTGSGRYVRMYGTARATRWSYSLYSLQMYSSCPDVALAELLANR